MFIDKILSSFRKKLGSYTVFRGYRAHSGAIQPILAILRKVFGFYSPEVLYILLLMFESVLKSSVIDHCWLGRDLFSETLGGRAFLGTVDEQGALFGPVLQLRLLLRHFDWDRHLGKWRNFYFHLHRVSFAALRRRAYFNEYNKDAVKVTLGLHCDLHADNFVGKMSIGLYFEIGLIFGISVKTIWTSFFQIFSKILDHSLPPKTFSECDKSCKNQ